MKISTKLLLMLCCIPFLFAACKSKMAKPEVKVNYPEWVKNAIIYEVNVRQYTPEGTFKAFESHLPRLKELGVDILWIMPINSIGIKNRKIPDGSKTSLGSYYSVRDYQGVNPEFGNEADFKALVSKAHELGFKVILDWVANHSAWDNPWLTEHPDWYVKDSLGKVVSPFDWTDVAKLDYKNADMRKAMIAAMKYWVEKCDIDGFRCDVAGEVPVDFWENAREELQKVKPMFMLAEDEGKPELCNKAFDMNYGWRLHQLMHQVAKGNDSVVSLLRYPESLDSIFPKQAMKMNFVTNHDENSWNGTVNEKFGEGGKAFAILTYTFPGMPLIYSGQEAGLSKRLKFFTKDTINWANQELVPFYQTLNRLKHNNAALENPPFGGDFIKINNTEKTKVLTYLRDKEGTKVLVMLNLTPNPVTFSLKGKMPSDTFKEVFSGEEMTLAKDGKIDLPAWGYKLLETK